MFNTATVGLMILLLLGLWAQSTLVASSAAILLVIRLTRTTFLFPILEHRGVEIGLIFLTMAMLVPFAQGRIQMQEIWENFWTLPGLLAVIGGAVATHLNGRGLRLLADNAHMMVGLLVGSIIGVVVWGGIPVGPLMAAGVTYILLSIIRWLLGLIH